MKELMNDQQTPTLGEAVFASMVNTLIQYPATTHTTE